MIDTLIKTLFADIDPPLDAPEHPKDRLLELMRSKYPNKVISTEESLNLPFEAFETLEDTMIRLIRNDILPPSGSYDYCDSHGRYADRYEWSDLYLKALLEKDPALRARLRSKAIDLRERAATELESRLQNELSEGSATEKGVRPCSIRSFLRICRAWIFKRIAI